jgi:acyl carrier protein
MIDTIRRLLDEHGRLPSSAASLATGQDLYAFGLTSFAAVQLMLALEDTFDIEFPERMLNRRSFASIDAIAGCLRELAPQKMAS